MLSTLTVVLLPLLAAVLYSPTANPSSLNNDFTAKDNVLFVTAHPDDECMFFAPTILGLQSISQPPDIHVLALSFGNAEGLGETRNLEFFDSLDVLGIPQSHSHIVDHPDLQDDMTENWDPEIISNLVHSYVVSHDITTILTFDRLGVSGHLNHISLFWGTRRYAQVHSPSPKVYSLVSVPTFSKYLSVVSPTQAKFDLFWMWLLRKADGTVLRALYLLGVVTNRPEVPPQDAMPVFVSGVHEFLTAHKAMRQHWSQLVWFRLLYVLFSRYMWVNEWQEIRLHHIELPSSTN
ncbi:LmbE-like protein [Hymenopellis radicata]|nr:LmbE-like protein [Hymenopellis radicata]